MPRQLVCPQGHQWEVGSADAPSGSSAPRVCPVCRAPAVPSSRTEVFTPERSRPPGGTPPGALTLPPTAPAPADEAAELPTVPGYEILGVLGRGGMGVVYWAWQPDLNRAVALKMVLAGAHAGSHELARFQTEAEAVARLHHPHIVQIYGVGRHDEHPYLVLEYVDGGSLAQQLTGSPLPARRAAELVETLALAMHHAHQRGIVHRDLTPGNVLLTADGQPKITDFGLAKLLVGGGAVRTQSGAIVGTPSYMAPEQAAGKTREIGPATDVYGLGAVLYELLTGRPPFRAESPLETLLQVQAEEPVPPSRLQPQLPRDLGTICLKALAKVPQRRYATAGNLADDLRRWLNGEPIRARPVGPWERLWRWCRRNPAQAAAASLALMAFLAVTALAIGSVFALRLHEEKEQTRAALQAANEQRRRADELSSRLALQRGLTLCEQGDAARGMLWLAHSLQIAPADAAALQRDIRGSLAAWHRQLHPLRAVFTPQDSDLHRLAFSPDGKTLVTASGTKTARLYEVDTGQPLGIAMQHDDRIQRVTFSPDSKTVLTASQDQTARLWDAATGKPLAEPLRHQRPVMNVAFHPEGKTVLTATNDGTIQLWQASTGQRLGKPFTIPGGIGLLAFRPDGTSVLIAQGNIARLWDVNTGQPHGHSFEHAFGILSLAFSPDGKTVVTGSRDNTAQLWEVDTGRPRGGPLQTPGNVFAVAFSPDGKTVATGTGVGEIARLWEADTGRPIGHPLAHQAQVKHVHFSPDGKTLLTFSVGKTGRRWEVGTGKAPGIHLPYHDWIHAVRFSPDGQSIVTGGLDGKVRLWHATTGRLERTLEGHTGEVWDVAFSPDGTTLVTVGEDRTAQLWKVNTGESIGQPWRHSTVVWAVAFNPDGQTVLTGGVDGTCQLWKVNTGEPLDKVRDHKEVVLSVAFSTDGQRVLTGSADGTAQLRDAVTLQPVGPPLRLRRPVYAVAFSPDGKTLVTGCADGTAQLWEAGTGQPRSEPLPHQGSVYGVAFSPDGQTLVTGSGDGTAQLWEVATGKPFGTPLRHQGAVWKVAFSPDGKTILTGGGDSARLWQPPAPVAGDVEQIKLWAQVITGMELDANGVVRGLDAPAWQQCRQRLKELGGPPLP